MTLTTASQNAFFPPGTQMIEGVGTNDRIEISADEGLARAHESRNHPSWSSLLPDPASAELNFTASGDHLEFLSLFLTKPRNLEICFWEYAQWTIPEEFEALQILSPDEFEPQVWAAFLSVNVPDENGHYGDFGADSMTSIRNIAVHRWDYDTATIRAAATQAFRLSDGVFLQKLERILKVLYADVATDQRYPVTEQQREAVYDLLSPSNQPIESTHQLFETIQKLGEQSSYDFCKRHLPQALVHHRIAVAEQVELGWWHKMIETQRDCVPTNAEEREFAAQVSEKVQKTWPRPLRNATAHREMIYINENEGNGLERLTDPVAKYVRVLGDEETAITIEQLTAETKALLLKKHAEWTDPAWCHGRGWKLIGDRIRRSIAHWEPLLHPCLDKGVCILPIIQMYNRSDERMYILARENGWLMDPSPKLHFYDTPRPPVEREDADEADANDATGHHEAPTGSEGLPENCDDEWANGDGNSERDTSTVDGNWGTDAGADNQSALDAAPWTKSEHPSQATYVPTAEVDTTGSGSWMGSSSTVRATDGDVSW
ncbi:MAG: hypothetical protein Q9196_006092 [Gyalolechia fulgens]